MTVIYLKTHNDFFKWLWDYESVMGMILGLFVLSAITIYLFIRGKKRYIFVTMTPGFIAGFIAASYICHGNPGLNMSWTASYIIAAILSASYVGLTIWYGKSIIDRLKAL